MRLRTLSILILTSLVLASTIAAAQPDADRPDKPDRAERPDREDKRPDGVPGIARACQNVDEDKCANLTAATSHVQARRAAHHADAAGDAIEKRVFRLEMKEFKARTALESGELNETEAAEMEAKIIRIQAAQDQLLQRATEMSERVEKLKAKYDGVKTHMEAREKVEICHAGDDGNKTLRLPSHAAEKHVAGHDGDSEGACAEETHEDLDSDESEVEHEFEDESDHQEASDDESEEESEQESEEESETDEDSPTSDDDSTEDAPDAP